MKIEYINHDGKQTNCVFKVDQVSCVQKRFFDECLEVVISGTHVHLYFQDVESCNKAFDAIAACISSAEEAQN